ncbi:MAG: transcription antitermination factor NusB [Thiopseudomonas sp.]|nr:transcription antitermination factor NusB [Thiopseudomonas sp.]
MSLNNDDYGDNPPPRATGKIAKRRVARTLLMQAVYQWQLAGQTLNAIDAQFRVDNDFEGVDGEYFSEGLRAIAGSVTELDELFSPYLDRAVSSLDPVELAILRLAAWEFSQRIDVPYRVVLNEGIELAKQFGATDGHKYVNGVLDKLALKLRSAEINHDRK